MEPQQPLTLLGGLSPQQFMRRHWQKKPLLVRQAVPGFQPLLGVPQLLAMAGREEVESRLVLSNAAPRAGSRPRPARQWSLKQGPFARRSLPALTQPGWTLLVQGVDLHHAPAHEWLQQFRFLPDARLDDLMISLATPGGGVGPHFDSYDVFLFQASGSRRWQIGAQKDLRLQPGMPLKILADFQPEQEFVLHAGDMLYLPPRYAHDGVAVESAQAHAGPCMTYSVGFRAPSQSELASALLQRLAERVTEDAEERPPRMYRDPAQAATATPAQVPLALQDFAREALERAAKDPGQLACLLGEYLSEPKPSVWFDAPAPGAGELSDRALRLHARSRMLYDADRIYINGEAYLARGADARLMRSLADERVLSPDRLRRASSAARDLLSQWLADGWVTQD